MAAVSLTVAKLASEALALSNTAVAADSVLSGALSGARHAWLQVGGPAGQRFPVTLTCVRCEPASARPACARAHAITGKERTAQTHAKRRARRCRANAPVPTLSSARMWMILQIARQCITQLAAMNYTQHV